MTAQGDLQRRLTSDALTALDGTDFALAGAGAIREHGITDRPTRDIDLFTASIDADRFAAAVDRLCSALAGGGYTVEVLRRAATFARLLVRTIDDGVVEIDLAADWRGAEPVRLAVGPVLALTDAIGSKLAALYSRAETRDFLDVDAIRRFGRLTDAQLIEILADRDPGYDRRIFAGQLGLVAQVTATEAARYGIGAEDLAAVRQRLTAWARELRS